jgi:hypothetical protein
MQKWQFECVVDDDGRPAWRWVQVTSHGEATASDTLFGSFYDCAANAAEHGYDDSSPARLR